MHFYALFTNYLAYFQLLIHPEEKYRTEWVAVVGVFLTRTATGRQSLVCDSQTISTSINTATQANVI